MNISQKIQVLKPHQILLKQSKIGLEKEGLRVTKKGSIAHTPHPAAFGSALTNPYITTDFSEALLELITPATDMDTCLNFLSDTQHFVYRHLENEENLWGQSMPCVIRGETSIPLAQYGTSNVGTMKTVYRRGLGVRYGRTMQVIAGVHFNYSYSHEFWQAYQQVLGVNPLHTNNAQQPLQNFINQHYMGLVRNLLRFGWLIVYLFGASPAVCTSFLRNYYHHNLQMLDKQSLYEPNATSLRTGDIGYQNSQEDKAGVKANYNSLSHYANSLELATQTPCEEYLQFDVKKQGQYQQLNSNVLQIENEYYASVRPKQTPIGLERPTQALQRRGIEYVELRSLDLNPLIPLGVDKTQLQFVESLFLFCLLENSPPIASCEQVAIDSNTSLVAHNGRTPKLKLNQCGQSISLRKWGDELCEKITQCAQLLGEEHIQSVKVISKRLAEPALTPSAMVIEKIQSDKLSFFDFSNQLSKQHQAQYLDKSINQAQDELLKNNAIESRIKQQAFEKDTLPFEQYLAHYFA